MTNIWNGSLPKNIILITIDCLRNDIVETDLPTIERLKKEGLSGNCYTTGSGTTTAMPGIMQSSLATDFDSIPSENRLKEQSPTLAECLQDLDIHCSGYHSNPYLDEFYGYHRGFDTYIDLQSGGSEAESKKIGGINIPGELTHTLKEYSQRLNIKDTISAVYQKLGTMGIVKRPAYGGSKATTHKIIDWLNEEVDATTRFAWGHYMNAHTPFFPPSKYREMVSNCPESDRRVRQLTFRKQWELSEEELSKLKNIYIACALCVDDQISEVISSLKSEGMYKSTLLMITADHGEMFGEMEVPGGKPFGHPGYLVEEQAAVPFIIAGGGVPSGSLDSLVSTMDIAPTLIDLFNHTQPDSWRGTVIGGPRFTEREYVISVTETKKDDGDMPKGTLHVSIRTDELAVLWWGHHSQPIEAYKLTDNGCGEIKIQAPTEHETCIQLREMIKSRFSAAAARSLSRSTEIDPGEEISNRLRDLGYIE